MSSGVSRISRRSVLAIISPRIPRSRTDLRRLLHKPGRGAGRRHRSTRRSRTDHHTARTTHRVRSHCRGSHLL
nr:MAG TPA: hypothetical protein [Caudoviricetes sp.]